jgi:hypothetical protein
MARDAISTCPVCQGELLISRLHCRSCGTALEGEFGVGRFGRLTKQQLGLLESFLRARGNLKEMERELGISYPTVRARVDALVRALDLADGTEPLADVDEPFEPADDATVTDAAAEPDTAVAQQRRAILERLSRREIGAEEAAAALRDLGVS